MANNYESLNNLEGNTRKSSLVQERTGLVAVHMYKQFLDFQKSTQNTNEIFLKMTDIMGEVAESLRQSFSIRNIPSNNIYYEIDSTKTVATIRILWHTISFTSSFNTSPKALPRKDNTHLFCGRIFAVKGDFNHLMQGIKDYDSQIDVLLENEVASLYIPPEKNQSVIMTIRHKNNEESLLTHFDAPTYFLLKVIEIVCGGGQTHKQEQKNKFFPI